MYIKNFSLSITQSGLIIKTSQLMLYREIIAVCSQKYIQHINTLHGQNVEFFNVWGLPQRCCDDKMYAVGERRYRVAEVCPINIDVLSVNGDTERWRVVRSARGDDVPLDTWLTVK
jgi:hypothetical protein